MRLSHSWFKTEREAPSDAKLISHQLLARAGFIRRVGTGIYTLTPLAVRVIDKLAAIAKEEMAGIGGEEILLPVVQPATLWEESGRYEKVDNSLARWTDRNGQNMVLAMTHEEAVTDLARHLIHSYRQLPMMFYQVQMKFRDELRPRGGLVRLREFLMKDAYSFHETAADLDKFYDSVIAAYHRFFARCGVSVVRVEADTGIMGGAASHEFMVLSEGGEDTLFICRHCGYAANREVAVTDGEHCARCGNTLEVMRGIEAGNTFKLGTNYSETMKATYADKDGTLHPLYMGCYGIGITRMLACLVEDNHDDKGIVFPEAVAPYKYHLVRIGDGPEVTAAAEKLYTDLGSARVLYDDRDITAGVKFQDADLVGLPYRLIVSSRSLANGGIEMYERRTSEVSFVTLANVDYL